MKDQLKKRTYSMPVQREFLSKHRCLQEADRILREGHIRNMNRIQLAKEIYFHTTAFYFATFAERFWIRLEYIKKHADPIDIADGGDTLFRRFCFHTLWLLPLPARTKRK